MPLELVTIPCLQDNYAYLLHAPGTPNATLVDAPEVGPVLKELLRREWLLSDILLTHHHDDHIQGVRELCEVTGAKVLGADADRHRLPPLNWPLEQGDLVEVGREPGRVIDVPGHTRGHIAFHFQDSNLAFTGDSLMSGGCGRLFEGTPEEMFASLQKLAALPPETVICSGHEYTASNLRFAATIEPDNAALQARIAACTTARAEGKATVPVLLSVELATNPYLRCHLPQVKAAVGLPEASDLEVFTEIRARKDRF
jgi:hydroxyacylglutathione hydrolase